MTTEATEISFEEKFIEEHCIGSYAVNAYELFQSYGEHCLRIAGAENTAECLIKDAERFKRAGVANTFKYLDLHILVLKNEYVVIGFSSPARNEEYTRKFGMQRALRNVIEKAYGFLGFQIKEERAEEKTHDCILETRLQPRIYETHSSQLQSWRYSMTNLNTALGVMFGFKNIQAVLNNVDLCITWLPSGFKTIGYWQELNPENYRASVNRINAIHAARLELLPYLQYHHLNQ